MPVFHRAGNNSESQMPYSATDATEDVEDDFPQKQRGFVAPRYMGTLADQRDMSALGRVQVLRVCDALLDS